MKRLVLEGFESGEIDSALGNPHVMKLVREINHRYGLEVYGVSAKDNLLGRAKVHMGTSSGLPVCTVYASAEDDDTVIYNYHSPWRQKERGSSEEDRETYRSKKLNVLMATLQKFNVMPKAETLIKAMFERPLTGIVYNQLLYTFKSTGKEALPAEYAHALLKRMFDEADDSVYGTLDRTICKGILDNYNRADETAKERDEAVQRIWGEPFYAIGVNSSPKEYGGVGDYIVGKGKMVFTNTPYGKDRSLEIVEPFKRMKSLYAVEELRGILTILKVSHDKKAETNSRMLGSDFLIPVQDYFDRDLEVAYGYDRINRYDHQWMVIPCTAL